MITKPNMMDQVLIFKGQKGEVTDLKTNGFDLLLQKDYNAFSFWIGDALQTVQSALEKLKTTWMSLRSSEEKYKLDQIKALKTRRHQRHHKKHKRDKSEYAKRQKLESILIGTVTVVHVC